MAKGFAVLVGVAYQDPRIFGPIDDPDSICCESVHDVYNMERVLLEAGHNTDDVYVYPTQTALKDDVFEAIEYAADSLEAGDLFVFYYSGHGDRVEDEEGLDTDCMDETISLFDEDVVDDEFDELWLDFAPGVRIMAICDSCHSGTMFRPDQRPGQTMTAHMLLASSCADRQESSLADAEGSIFTNALVEVWDHGRYHGDYESFFRDVAQKVRGNAPDQTPVFAPFPPVSREFLSMRPFRINR